MRDDESGQLPSPWPQGFVEYSRPGDDAVAHDPVRCAEGDGQAREVLGFPEDLGGLLRTIAANDLSGVPVGSLAMFLGNWLIEKNSAAFWDQMIPERPEVVVPQFGRVDVVPLAARVREGDVSALVAVATQGTLPEGDI